MIRTIELQTGKSRKSTLNKVNSSDRGNVPLAWSSRVSLEDLARLAAPEK